MKKLLLAPILIAFVNGCADSSSSSGPAGAHGGQAPTIVSLRLRSGFVDILGGANGRTYRVLDTEGKLLASDLSEADFKARFPEHSQALERALAQESEAPLDASLHLQTEASSSRPGEPSRALLYSTNER